MKLTYNEGKRDKGVYMQNQTSLKDKTKVNIKPPKNYKVIMYNDDFTTMDFVVDVLTQVFHKNQLQAEQIMTDVHKQGKGIAGVYPYDLAATKAQKAMMWAREEGFPFKLTVEEA